MDLPKRLCELNKKISFSNVCPWIVNTRADPMRAGKAAAASLTPAHPRSCPHQSHAKSSFAFTISPHVLGAGLKVGVV